MRALLLLALLPACAHLELTGPGPDRRTATLDTLAAEALARGGTLTLGPVVVTTTEEAGVRHAKVTFVSDRGRCELSSDTGAARRVERRSCTNVSWSEVASALHGAGVVTSWSAESRVVRVSDRLARPPAALPPEGFDQDVERTHDGGAQVWGLGDDALAAIVFGLDTLVPDVTGLVIERDWKIPRAGITCTRTITDDGTIARVRRTFTWAQDAARLSWTREERQEQRSGASVTSLDDQLEWTGGGLPELLTSLARAGIEVRLEENAEGSFALLRIAKVAFWK